MAGEMWILQTAEPDGSLTFRLRPGAIKTVGRAPRADFIVDAALVSRLHCRIVPKRKQHGSNRTNQRVVVAARQIGPADGAGEQRVADKELVACLPFRSDLQADAAGAMARRVMRPNFVPAERDDLIRGVEH